MVGCFVSLLLIINFIMYVSLTILFEYDFSIRLCVAVEHYFQKICFNKILLQINQKYLHFILTPMRKITNIVNGDPDKEPRTELEAAKLGSKIMFLLSMRYVISIAYCIFGQTLA